MHVRGKLNQQGRCFRAHFLSTSRLSGTLFETRLSRNLLACCFGVSCQNFSEDFFLKNKVCSDPIDVLFCARRSNLSKTEDILKKKTVRFTKSIYLRLKINYSLFFAFTMSLCY